MRLDEYTDLQAVYDKHKKEHPQIPAIDVLAWVRKYTPNKRGSIINCSYFFTEDRTIYVSPSVLMDFYYYMKALTNEQGNNHTTD
tara:strand:+ start:10980 stop:11234 length:255 start_codon:yes stop_codon:yes gene_type:complete